MINMVRAVRFILPRGRVGNAEGVVNRGGHLFGCLRIARRIAADPVGGTDHTTRGLEAFSGRALPVSVPDAG